MRKLLILMGAPGSGKSTWVAQNSLGPCTVAPDVIRLLHSNPEMTVTGDAAVPQKYDSIVWKMVDSVIEHRMSIGAFTIIDATNTKDRYFKKYLKLAEEYRYRVYVKRFDPPYEELLSRNQWREQYKIVPDKVVLAHYEHMQTINIPKEVTEIAEIGEVMDGTDYKELNEIAPEARSVYFIGDIHGTIEPLTKFLEEHYNDNDLFVFLGDYIDRGTHNAEVINRLIDLSVRKNVVFLEGNHEKWLYEWSRGNESGIRSREFSLRTMPQLEEKSDKKKVRNFCRKLKDHIGVIMTNGTQKVFIFACHGGINPNGSYGPWLTPSDQLINGVGEYDDLPELYEEVMKRDQTIAGLGVLGVLVHGHRNNQNYPLLAEAGDEMSIMNLDGHVEFGGNMRVAKFNTPSFENQVPFFEHFEYKNENFVPTLANKGGEDMVYTGVTQIDLMRRMPKYIREKVEGDISSFNFTHDAFNSQKWNKMTTKARGLFINNKTNKVVARSYDKFFNLEEVGETQWRNLNERLVFPVNVYLKENGFLGIVGYDPSTDKVLYCSKSTTEGYHAALVKEVLDEKGITEDRLRPIVSEGRSIIFEIIHPTKDPHIIEYKETRAVLLDIVDNEFEFKKNPITEVRYIGDSIGSETKELIGVVHSIEELKGLIGRESGLQTEGLVIEDSNGFMFKVKNHYYSIWKRLRSLKDKVFLKGFSIESIRNIGPISKGFLEWCRTRGHLYVTGADIITLRNEYLEGNDMITYD